MNEQQRTDVRRTSDWLTGDVEIQISRKILAAAGLVPLIFVGVALD